MDISAPAATMEMQLQVDDADDMLGNPSNADPCIDNDMLEDQYDIELGTEADLVETTAPSPLLHRSESTYPHTHHWQKSKPLHCQLPPGTLFNKRYKLDRILGKGSFGCAYLATDVLDGGEVVLKARVGNGKGSFSESIHDELQVYLQLGATERQIGIPYIAGAGLHKLIPSAPEGRPVYVSYMAMQRLGDSIWTCCHRMTQRTVYNDITGLDEYKTVPYQPSRDSVVFAGLGMLKSLAAMHARGIIHRDVKTENFCLGGGHDNENIYAIDYGFARPAFGWYPYHKYNQKCASFWGTPNYSSLRGLERYPQTSRDDLEALVYCVMEMEMSNCLLPWNSKLTTNSEAAAGWTDDQLDRMAREKLDFIDEACNQGLIPDYLTTLFEYIYTLKYSDVPDYAYIYRVLQSGLTGVLPSPPKPRLYQDFPVNGCATDEQHRRVTASLLAQLQAAAVMALQMSDDVPGEPTADDTVAISSAVVSPQQHQAGACNLESMSDSSDVECNSEDEDSDVDQAICVQASADGSERQHDVESHSGVEYADDSNGSTKHSHSSPPRLAQALPEAQHTLPSSTCPVRQPKRQRVDQDAVAACFGQVMQVVLESSQEE